MFIVLSSVNISNNAQKWVKIPLKLYLSLQYSDWWMDRVLGRWFM